MLENSCFLKNFNSSLKSKINELDKGHKIAIKICRPIATHFQNQDDILRETEMCQTFYVLVAVKNHFQNVVVVKCNL